MNVQDVVGIRVAEARQRRGITQQELADELTGALGKRWYSTAVSAAERGGRQFTAVELVALSHLLGVAPGLLVTPPAGEAMDVGNLQVHASRRGDSTAALEEARNLLAGAVMVCDQMAGSAEAVSHMIGVAERQVADQMSLGATEEA